MMGSRGLVVSTWEGSDHSLDVLSQPSRLLVSSFAGGALGWGASVSAFWVVTWTQSLMLTVEGVAGE